MMKYLPIFALFCLANLVNAEELKTNPDPLPDGVTNFNGMLLGQLVAKDVEDGTFVVLVDAVPRVWRNSKAKDPESFVGKTVKVDGVFGKFLDVLVVTRNGETLEFECKYEDEALRFPGELLRKAAPYDPEDFPVLPEEFRGFKGAVLADVVKKDAETLEMIVQVREIIEPWDGSRAKDAKSMEGKRMTLAGFWNRRDDYHNLKTGDRIQFGMQHISVRSNHVSLDRFVRKVETDNAREMMQKSEDTAVGDGLTKELRGFRGMLVGKLVKKDVERGTFTINVDAVPRVWRNNQATAPKRFIGRHADAGEVPSSLLDALVVTRVGETLEFCALHEDGERMRVGEVLRKVAPVKPGDYPELPDAFRGFRGMVEGKILKKDDHLLELIVEITNVGETFPACKAQDPNSIVGKKIMLTGFWRRKDDFHGVDVGDTICTGIEHPQKLSDHLSVIETFQKADDRDLEPR